VTGGAGEGIGHGIVWALAAQGWSLLIVDRDSKQLASLVGQLNKSNMRAVAMAADITLPDVAETAVKRALQEFGRLDGLVNSAGVGLCKPLGEISDTEFDRLFDTDLRASFRFIRAALPALLESKGSVVSIGSVHAARSIRGYGAYAATKAGLEALTRGITIDYGELGVRANVVHPGMVMSPQNEALIRSFTPDPKAWVAKYTATKQLLPALPTAEQVGEAVAWLLGPRSGSITGQALSIDGGTSAMLYERESSS
jgi:NAD(P)-dependent dehydrogenase (short-subunit alcohol dehydrogenase family)